MTLGIYSWVWYYNIIERWGNYVRKQNQMPSLSGSTYLLWLIVGAFLAGIGILVATHLYLKAWNETNEVYNRLAAPAQPVVDPVKS